jgi:signal transduction histidine kinase
VSLSDEIGELTRAFVQMKRDVKLAREQITQKQHELEAANREIRTLNQDLERRIADRTRELQAALDELRTLDQSKDDFITLVSHELRTPLTSILACADGLLEVGVGGAPAERDRLLGIIRDEGNRLSRLINDVLTLQRIEVGRMPFEFARVNLRHLVEKTCWTMEPAAQARKVRVRFAGSPDPRLRAVRADYDRIVQAVTNLLSNAIKFSPAGATVEATVEVARDGAAEVARVAVRDAGPGIAGKDARRVFDKFYQAELIDHHSEGSGLGLPIARSIVEEHGGRIGFDPAAGRGTVFHFTLPLATEDA